MSESQVRRVRLFLDANILVSVAWKEGSRVARIWQIDDAELITSEYVLEECRRNLRLPGQQERLNHFVEQVRIVRFPGVPALQHPPGEIPVKDQPVLAAAVLSRADFLVTGDMRHFGAWYGKTILGIRVEPPGSFPDVLRTSAHHPGY